MIVQLLNSLLIKMKAKFSKFVWKHKKTRKINCKRFALKPQLSSMTKAASSARSISIWNLMSSSWAKRCLCSLMTKKPCTTRRHRAFTSLASNLWATNPSHEYPFRWNPSFSRSSKSTLRSRTSLDSSAKLNSWWRMHWRKGTQAECHSSSWMRRTVTRARLRSPSVPLAATTPSLTCNSNAS